MIYITGDTHGTVDFAKLPAFAEQHPELTKNDYMIVAGDFGGLWDVRSAERTLDLYSALPFTVLFVDGNHENYDLLDACPVETWKGGKVHTVRPDILHLMRGQVFEIEGNRIFTFGGATSTDKFFRIEGVSVWERETPSLKELEEGLSNLQRYGNEVDYIVTHSCDERALYFPPLLGRTRKRGVYAENGLLSRIEETVR